MGFVDIRSLMPERIPVQFVSRVQISIGVYKTLGPLCEMYILFSPFLTEMVR